MSDINEKSMLDFGFYLRKTMARRGHTIPSLAKLLKREDGRQMSVETVRRWVAGKGAPRRGIVEQLASVLNIDPQPLYMLISGSSMEDVDAMNNEHTQVQPEQTPGAEIMELDIKAALARIAALEQRIASIEAKQA